MATRIRLRRTGKKKQANYRVVVADSRSPRDGRFVEILGNYNPNTNPPQVEISEERALYWLMQGAQPSDTVRSLLSKKGILAKLAEESPGHATLKRPHKKRAGTGVKEPKPELQIVEQEEAEKVSEEVVEEVPEITGEELMTADSEDAATVEDSEESVSGDKAEE